MMIQGYARKSFVIAAVTIIALQRESAVVTFQGARTGSAQSVVNRSGSTATRLPEGQWLLLGGEGSAGPLPSASLFDESTQQIVSLPTSMVAARAWHTATVLSDGTVLIAGGRNGSALVEVPEIFDPATRTFTPFSLNGAVRRAAHTATLLTDGRVLVAGGSNGGGSPLATEVWDLETHTATAMSGQGIDRANQTATLMADGTVRLTGGRTHAGALAAGIVTIDPLRGTVLREEAVPETRTVPALTASIPADGATYVPLDAHLVLRFSQPLTIESLSAATVILTGPTGSISTRVIAAEQGRLAFVWPGDRFTEGARYTLSVSGAVDPSGVSVAPASVTFTTVRPISDRGDVADDEEWVPDAESLRNGWRTNRQRSAWESLEPRMAPSGVTAISGRVLTLDGRPLAGVTLSVEGAGEAESDRTGRFLLVAPSLTTTRHVLEIKGEGASRPGRKYGFFEYGMTVVAGQTNVLPFTIWMPRLDTRHVVTIPSPTTAEVVVTTPSIPGLELHIPPRTVIRGEDGKPVTRVGITAIPVDRPPFPLAKNVDVPVYFTVQPGSSYVHTAGSGPKGAWLVYPNYREQGVPGQRVQFFHYDPEIRDWYVYGAGTVTRNGAQVVPDPTTRLYEFTGAMINVPGWPPFLKWLLPGPRRGDPMDPSTGLFSADKTDLYLPDVIPLALTRTYNSGDGQARPFGFGMMHSYSMFLWSANEYQEVDLMLPEGGMLHYVRTSSGTGYSDAVFEHTATPTAFYKSTITWNGNGWNLTRKDGTVYVFGDHAPLQAIRDRYGNTVTITHASGQGGNITRVTSPNGRYIAFTYDTSNRITQASDNIGRTVGYVYDTNGNLSTVSDPENAVTTYTYDASHRLLTIRDGRNIVYLTNQYDTNGRVSQQTLADTNATYQFSYTLSAGSVTQTDITDPRGHVERLVFNSDHYVTSDTQAYGTSLARTTTTTRQTGSNLVTAVVDGLGRRTEYTYDSTGHLLTTTRLAGTSDAVTTTYTYEPTFSQPATVTDPLTHTWTLGYTAGTLTSVTDPLSHQTTVAMNAAGQVTSLTDPLSHQWQIGYSDGDLTSRTNPLGAVGTQFVDAAGRVVATTDPLGRSTHTTVDKLNRPTAVVDRAGGQTAFSYDANSNLLSLTDALTHATSYTYDTSDRVSTLTDPLTHAVSYQYDLNGNVSQVTDRKSQVTGSTYDALDRLTQVTFNDASTIAYTYDAGDRVTQIVDSTNGTITRTYDGVDRLTQETTPQGTVSYTYDAAGRRTTMTVTGQTAVSYTYDNANRVTAVTQGTASVAITYDNADRRSTLTFPNGIVATYGYDAANQLTSLTYSLSGNPLGDLTYAYDLSGHRTSVGGSWARTGLPATVTSATYDAANRIATWGGTSFSYDLNGNLTSDGTTTYTWNVRDQLTGLSGGTSASFQYDGTGRRRGKTISGTTTNFLYDELNFVQELTSGGTPTANVLTGLGIDETFTRTDASGTRTLLVDALGSTLELADASGTLQTHYTFEPFGGTTASGASSTGAQQYTGRENDGTGLYYYRARFYSPQRQRFVSEDPIGPAGGLNLFAYVANQPTTYLDPLGLKQNPVFGQPPTSPDGRDGPSRPGRPSRPAAPRGRGGPGGQGGPGGRGGPAAGCNSICQMAQEIGQRAGPMAEPLNYLQWVAASASGGALAQLGVAGAPLLPRAMDAATIATQDAAATIARTYPGGVPELGSDILQGAGPMPPTSPVQLLVNLIKGLFW